MYEDYWQLRAKPFEPVSSAEGFYASEAHQGAMLKLQYAVEQRRPLAVLSGPAGVGKTLLVDRLLEPLTAAPANGSPAVGPVARVVFPQMSHRDLLAYLADRLGAPRPEVATFTVDESVGRIESHLAANQQQGRHAVLVIDEAQLLEDTGLLETVRLLLNLSNDPAPPMTVLLVGQMGLLSALVRRPALDERVAVKALLRPLTAAETAEYVQARLADAEAARELFEPDAVEMLHALTGGIPRRIDRLGDLALVVGFADGLASIDATHLESISRELLTVTPE